VARDEKLDLLRGIPLFAKLDRHKIARVGELTDQVDVPAGKMLIRQGDTGGDLMVLVSGQVAIERDGVRVATLGGGDFFGEISLIDGRPRTATVTTETPSRLLVVSHREFHALMDQIPEVAAQILEALADRVRKLEPKETH
jgi:CRP/FNR family transcriptional regulator, cyclic AMP receptor protein